MLSEAKNPGSFPVCASARLANIWAPETVILNGMPREPGRSPAVTARLHAVAVSTSYLPKPTASRDFAIRSREATSASTFLAPR